MEAILFLISLKDFHLGLDLYLCRRVEDFGSLMYAIRLKRSPGTRFILV